MENRAWDYLWAVGELVPGMPKDKFRQRSVETYLNKVKWGRASVVTPVVFAMLMTQSATLMAQGTPVYDNASYLQQAKNFYDTQVQGYLDRADSLKRFLSNAFIAYKSYKMLNSIAERIRYGNIDFLVDFALPKLDFSYVDNNANGTTTITRTQISFVPSVTQGQDNLKWLMNYGNQKFARDLQQSQAKLATIGQQLEKSIISALENPDGDVTSTTIDPTTGKVLDVRKPEVWVQLAQVDATAAWIYSQHRVGINLDYQDSDGSLLWASANQQEKDDLAVQLAYQEIMRLQQEASQNGTSLNNPTYWTALKAYYSAVEQSNFTRSHTSVQATGTGPVGVVTDGQRLQYVEEDVRSIQEHATGMNIAIMAAQNRNTAMAANLQTIGQAYSVPQVQGTQGLLQFINQPSGPGETLKVLLGVQLKQLEAQQTQNQHMSEILKILAAQASKEAKDDLAKKGEEKAAIMRNASTNVAASAVEAQTEADATQDAAATQDLYELLNMPLEIPQVDPFGTPDANGVTPVVGSITVTAGTTDISQATTQARQDFENRKSQAVQSTISKFRSDLTTSMQGVKGTGFLFQLVAALAGAFRQMFGLNGGNYNLKDEAASWESSAKGLDTVYQGSIDPSAVGAESISN